MEMYDKTSYDKKSRLSISGFCVLGVLGPGRTVHCSCVILALENSGKQFSRKNMVKIFKNTLKILQQFALSALLVEMH